MKKRILVTGSAGFIGSHFVDHIHRNTDWHVIGLDSFRHRGDSLRTVNKDHTRYDIHTHDLTAPLSDRQIAKIGHVDYIVNFASESHVDRSITDPVPFVENNVKLMLNVLEYVRKIKPEVMIQISTDEVYGAALQDTLHAEWSTILPSNPYSASKGCQESLAYSYWRTYQLPIVITNTMNITGEQQDREKFVPMLISKILKGEEVIIHGDEKGIGSRFYLHARNQADGILFILKNTVPTLYHDSMDEIILPDRYNIVGDVEVNNLEMARMIADILNKPLNYKLVNFHATRPGHDRRYALDGTKMRKMGWVAPVPFYESLKKTVEWTIQHPEWLV